MNVVKFVSWISENNSLFPRIEWKIQKQILDNAHKDALGKLSPQALDDHCYAIRFEDSVSRFQLFTLWKQEMRSWICLSNFVLRLENQAFKFEKKVENIFQMNLGGFVGTNKFALKTPLHTRHKKMRTLKEFWGHL